MEVTYVSSLVMLYCFICLGKKNIGIENIMTTTPYMRNGIHQQPIKSDDFETELSKIQLRSRN